MSAQPQDSIPFAPTRPSDLRQANSRALLRLLKDRASCSKADLARLSGLSAPTVSSAISDLARNGLVEVLGDGTSSGGRPPEMLRFNAEHGYVVGVDIGGTRLRMMLSDLTGKIAAQWQTTLADNEKDPDSVAHLIHTGLLTMCAEPGVTKERVLHIAAGAPGITDARRGVVFSAPNLTNWNEVPLSALIHRTTGVAVSVENDTNLAAVGEHWAGSAKGVEDFVFIAMGTGVGSGVYLGGKLHHGAAWSAGEIGYLGVKGLPREVPSMQRTGQLERTIGGIGIEQQWMQQLQTAGRNDAFLAALRSSEIFRLATEGDPDAQAVLNSTAVVLADAITTITLLLNPKLIVLGGGVGASEGLRLATERLLAESDFPQPSLRTSILGTQAQLYGAISIALSAVESKLLC